MKHKAPTLAASNGLRAESRGLAAFTLIELMVVLALIGILTAMIIPEMKGSYEDALLRSTGRDVVNVFNLAYSRAVSLNQAHRVVLDRKTGKYLLEKRELRQGERRASFVPVRDVPGSEGTLDTRITIEIRKPSPAPSEGPEPEPVTPASEADPDARSGMEVITFYPDGTADERQVLLKDRDGFGLVLRLNPVTARVHIVDMPRALASQEAAEEPRNE